MRTGYIVGKELKSTELFLTERNTWVFPINIDSSRLFPTRKEAEEEAKKHGAFVLKDTRY